MDFMAQYGLFLAKLITVVVFLFLIVGGIALFTLRGRRIHREDYLEVKHLNRKYENMALTLKSAVLPKKVFKQTLKEVHKAHKQAEKVMDEPSGKRRVFVLKFKGDIRASAVMALCEEITAVLEVARSEDEVVVLLESLGGLVHAYGLAASQLVRIRQRNIKLTVAIDGLAASGGYMMACVADRIIASPFAIIGSIGVVAELPNFNRLLKDLHIDYEQITAGEYKRTLTVFGENTEKGRAKLREEMEDLHALFKDFIKEHRAQVDIPRVATGEHWHGVRAQELKLVDELKTSDDYLLEASKTAELYEVSYHRKRHLVERVTWMAAKMFQRDRSMPQGPDVFS